jgi:hypothetical protein
VVVLDVAMFDARKSLPVSMFSQPAEQAQAQSAKHLLVNGKKGRFLVA